MPILTPMNMSLGTFCALNCIPGWGEILALPVPERIERLRDAGTRGEMLRRADSKEAGVFRRLADFGRYVIGDTCSAANEGLSGRVVDDIAAERGQDAFHCLVEIYAADDLRTVLWPMPTDNDPCSWALRQRTWEHEDVLLGGSDAGAHLDRMCRAPYTTRFLGDCLRGRRLVSLTAAVKMLTDDPARLYGLREKLMELGGKGAALVLDDADVDSAVASIGTTFSFYSGQICTAPTRVLVHRSRQDELIAALTAYANRLTVGDPPRPGHRRRPGHLRGPPRPRRGVRGAGPEGGRARIVTGGARPGHLERGFYVAPTLLADCTPDMRVVREEIFGPVVVVVPFDDEEEGIALANDSDYGLIDYVWCADVARAFRIARRLRAGGVDVNTVGRNTEAPFGGFRKSGVGRDVGSYALHAYSETQAIVWPG